MTLYRKDWFFLHLSIGIITLRIGKRVFKIKNINKHPVLFSERYGYVFFKQIGNIGISFYGKDKRI